MHSIEKAELLNTSQSRQEPATRLVFSGEQCIFFPFTSQLITANKPSFVGTNQYISLKSTEMHGISFGWAFG